jgi:general secretion pathway protein D
MKRLIVMVLAALALTMFGCTSFRAWEEAQHYEELEQWDQAVLAYERALEIDPKNVRYRMALQRAKLEASRAHFGKGKDLLAAGHFEMAALELQIATRLDPTNQFAAIELAKAVAGARRQHDAQYRDIEEMKRRITEQSRPPVLDPASNQPISLSFPRETSVKEIYRALGSAFGINIMFDQRLTDDKISIELRDVTAQDALERVMQASGHFYKVLDQQTIIVIPDNAQTRREYEDLVIRTFYLSNGDAEQVTNVVRTMIEARNVFPLKALNAITIRDTADKVLIAERIIEANDKARAEVVVQVELLQVDEQKLRDIGLALRSGSGPFSGISAGLATPDGEAISVLPIDGFRDLGSANWFLNVPSLTYNLLKNSSDATLLARPQLRISEGETATLHIGQQVPIAITTYNQLLQPGQGGQVFAPPTQYQYRDVGIKISIEPRVHHNREVTLKLSVEVSNVQESGGTSDQPIIGTRTIESTIRLKDGETNFLAGLLRRDESQGDTQIPFLSDLPVVGRLFSSNRRGRQSTDLILTMTPHIIRIADITEEDLRPMWVGTSQNITFRGMTPRMEGRNDGDPFVPTPVSPERRQFQQSNPPEDPPPAPMLQPIEEPQGTPSPRDPVPESRSEEYDPFRQRGQPQSQGASSVLTERPYEGGASEDLPTHLTPRIAAQPAFLDLAPGDVAVWSVVGMDLDGLGTAEIELHYDPAAVEVTAMTFGSAVIVDPNLPPTTTVDSTSGVIRIVSDDGEPLRFRSGGEILHLAVRAVLPGDSSLVVSKLDLSRKGGQKVVANITGGRASIEFR